MLSGFCRYYQGGLWITRARLWITQLILIFVLSQPAHGIEDPGATLNNDVGVFTVLGTKVDLSRSFTDHTGRVGALGEFVIPDAPVLVVPVYYRCPRLCGLVLDGVIALLNELPLLLGKELTVLAISINPTEKSEEGAEVREKFLGRLKLKQGADSNALRFLVGNEDSVRGVMGELGFKFLPDGDDFAHSAAVMILTPQGEISQYFTGISFSAWDVRLALVEASNGRIGSAIDHFLLYCFRFDSLKGKYTWAVTSVLRIGGALTLLCLGAVLWFVARRKRRAGQSV